MTATLTSEQVGRLRRFATEEAASTDTGRDWLERLRPVGLELVRLYSGLPRARDRIDNALARTAKLVDSPRARIAADDIRAFESALRAVQAAASPELSELIGAVTDELPRTAGRTLRESIG